MASKDPHFLYLLPAEKPRIARAIAFLLGALTTTAFAPIGFGLLALLLPLPLMFAAMTVAPRDAGAQYFWYGLGLFLVGTYWIYVSVHVFGNAALWVAMLLMFGLAVIMASFLRLAGWLTCRAALGEPWLLLLGAPAAWVLIEWLRGWVLTGFPWLALGYSQADSWLAGWAPVLGVYGVSLMLLVSSMGFLLLVVSRGRQRIAALGIACLPWLLGAALQQVHWTEASGEPLEVSIIQAGVPQNQKWAAAQRPLTLDFYRDATLDAADSDLVVWPEVAVPALAEQIAPYLDDIDATASRRGQTVLLGILERSFERSADGQVYNSVLLLGRGDTQAYRKRHLVPFGEYFPVPQFVRNWMKLQNLPYADLAAGDARQPLLTTPGGLQVAVAICYEDAYAAEQRYAFPDAGLIVNVSNDGWFGDSLAPHQHLEIARMLSLQFGRYTVRSTNNGISAFIAPDGKLVSTGRQFVAETLTTELQAYRGATPFARFGNWPVVCLSVLLLGLAWLRGRSDF